MSKQKWPGRLGVAQDGTGPGVSRGLGEGALNHTHYSVELELTRQAGIGLNKNGQSGQALH